MSSIRNPHIIATGALLSGVTPISVNVEQAITVEKGIAVNELNFNFQQEIVSPPVVWQLQDDTVRDAEYALLVMSSADLTSGTQKPFVESSLSTVSEKFGVQLSKVSSIFTDSVNEDPGLDSTTNYRIVFTLPSISYGPKYLFWDFSDEADRDTVFSELSGVIADATIL